jgi:hypothetical protein
MNRRVAAPVIVFLLALAGCGDDDADDAPPMTNEMGLETFEPEDDPWFMDATVEPGES